MPISFIGCSTEGIINSAEFLQLCHKIPKPGFAFLLKIFFPKLSGFLFVQQCKHNRGNLLFDEIVSQHVLIPANSQSFFHSFTGSSVFLNLLVKDAGKRNELVNTIPWSGLKKHSSAR